VGVEVALAVLLLTGAGLMVKSFSRMHAYPPGFDPERILTMKVMFTAPDYLDFGRRLAYVDELLRRMQTTSAVEAAGVTATGGASPLVEVTVEGTAPGPSGGEHRQDTHLYAASAGYPRAMGFRLMRGRWFTDGEARPVVLITERVARREFGGADPIGRLIRIERPSVPGAEPLSSVPVVGVVTDLRYSKLDAGPDPQIFIPYRHYPRRFVRLTTVVRTAGDASASTAEIQRVVSDIDPRLPVFDVMTIEQALADSIAPRRFNLLLLGTFAGVALLLAVIGIYGVIA
jgi:putative ABC transport system permease protein